MSTRVEGIHKVTEFLESDESTAEIRLEQVGSALRCQGHQQGAAEERKTSKLTAEKGTA